MKWNWQWLNASAAATARSDAHQNHGPGLSIVAAIARMHGDRTFASSADGITSIGMPLRTTSGKATGPSVAPGTAGLAAAGEGLRA